MEKILLYPYIIYDYLIPEYCYYELFILTKYKVGDSIRHFLKIFFYFIIITL